METNTPSPPLRRTRGCGRGRIWRRNCPRVWSRSRCEIWSGLIASNADVAVINPMFPLLGQAQYSIIFEIRSTLKRKKQASSLNLSSLETIQWKTACQGRGASNIGHHKVTFLLLTFRNHPTSFIWTRWLAACTPTGISRALNVLSSTEAVFRTNYVHYLIKTCLQCSSKFK